MKSDYVLIGSVLSLGSGLIFGLPTALFFSAQRIRCRVPHCKFPSTRRGFRQWRPADATWTPAAHRRGYERNRKDVTERAATRRASKRDSTIKTDGEMLSSILD